MERLFRQTSRRFIVSEAEIGYTHAMNIRNKNSSTYDTIYNLKEAILTTIGKKIGEKGKEKIKNMTNQEVFDYLLDMLFSEHSVISNIEIRIVDEMDKNIRNQIFRHTKARPRFYAQSSRPDWNAGKPRDPNEFTTNCMDWNAEAFREMMRQRLCFRTEANTNKWVNLVLNTMYESDDPVLNAVAFVAVPNCIYRYGCPEKNCCGYFAKFVEGTKDTLTDAGNLRARYLAYHKSCGRDFSKYTF